jgi:hypothetical protein
MNGTDLINKRVRIEFMNDPYPVPSGTEGTIVFVDSINQYHVKWDNGRTLAINPIEDEFTIL